MATQSLAAAIVVSLSCVILTASCVVQDPTAQSDDGPRSDGEAIGQAREDPMQAERTGEAQDPVTRAQCQEAFVKNLRQCDSWTEHKEVCQHMAAVLLLACIALSKE
jgi:hypothetical protein